MEIGDLVTYQDQRWFASSYDRVARVMVLFNLGGDRIELPFEFDLTHQQELSVIVNPSKKWQLLTAKVRSGAGPFVKLVVPELPRRPEIVLEPWVDWMPSDPMREGGSFLVNPERKIRPGVLLLATHKDGSCVRITVPQSIGTVAKRKAVAAPKKPEYNRFTRVLKGDDDL